MKKSIIKKLSLSVKVVLLVLMVSVLATGCFESTDVYSVSEIADILSKNPKAYNIHTVVKTAELTSEYRLTIDDSDGGTRARYEYTRQTYNIIENNEMPNEKISTESGVRYYRGSEVGQLVDNVMVWEEGRPPEYSPNNLSINEKDFNKTTIEKNGVTVMFKGELKDDKTLSVLGIDGITEATIEISLSDASPQRAETIVISYKRNGTVTSVTVNFGYNPQTVVIPT